MHVQYYKKCLFEKEKTFSSKFKWTGKMTYNIIKKGLANTLKVMVIRILLYCYRFYIFQKIVFIIVLYEKIVQVILERMFYIL